MLWIWSKKSKRNCPKDRCERYNFRCYAHQQCYPNLTRLRENNAKRGFNDFSNQQGERIYNHYEEHLIITLLPTQPMSAVIGNTDFSLSPEMVSPFSNTKYFACFYRILNGVELQVFGV